MFIRVAKEFDKPIRIGVNAGSLDPELLDSKMENNAKKEIPEDSEVVEKEALVDSALISANKAIDLGLEENKIIISCKILSVRSCSSICI